jgi:hypothetical protein
MLTSIIEIGGTPAVCGSCYSILAKLRLHLSRRKGRLSWQKIGAAVAKYQNEQQEYASRSLRCFMVT